MHSRFIIAALTLIGATLGLTVLLNRTTHETDARPRIATSVFPVHSIASEIAGDVLNVALLMPAGANPHTFEPTPDTVATLEEVPVIYTIGLGIDSWAQSLTTATTAAVPLTRNVALRTAGDGTVDPHYWLAIPNAKAMAEYLAEDLSRRYPQFEQTFRANLGVYLGELNTAESEMHEIMSHAENKNIITQHDAWYYFADAYGLNIIGTYEPSSGREPTPQDIATLAALAQEYQVDAFFADAGESEDAALAFTQDNHLNYVTLDAEGTSGVYDSYIDLMLGNARLISETQ